MERQKYAVYISDISYIEHSLNQSSPDGPIILGFRVSFVACLNRNGSLLRVQRRVSAYST